jgi:hypothetical protein
VKRDLKFWLSAAVLAAGIVAGYAKLQAKVDAMTEAQRIFHAENREDHIRMQQALLEVQREQARAQALLEGR